jgi:hypothetical protein
MMEERRKYSTRNNQAHIHCDIKNFLLLKDGHPVGRISAFVNRQAVNFWREAIGLFCSYECIDNRAGSALLLEAAREWLRKQGMRRMRGPWSFSSQEVGLLTEGFDSPPMIMSPYNPPYYNQQMEEFGLKKVKDLLAFELNNLKEYQLPEDYQNWADRIAEKNSIVIRPLNLKKIDEEIRLFIDIINQALRSDWAFLPVTMEEARDLARSLKWLFDPDTVMIAQAGDKTVGFLVVMPDLNVIIKQIKGRLFPFGFLKLLLGIKKIRQYRVIAMGIVPEYRRRAIDVIFYKKLCDILHAKEADKLEANFVVEDNVMMKNPIARLGFKEVKKYRVYEMAI